MRLVAKSPFICRIKLVIIWLSCGRRQTDSFFLRRVAVCGLVGFWCFVSLVFSLFLISVKFDVAYKLSVLCTSFIYAHVICSIIHVHVCLNANVSVSL